mgnify:CR=1 FL=1
MLALAAEALALSTSGRVARRVLALAGRAPALVIMQEQLGALVGATRNAVIRALRDLEEDGLLRRGYGRIEILDRAGLEAVGAPAA